MCNHLNLQIEPKWEEISTLHRRVSAFLRERRVAHDLVDAAAMMACELSENAVKYGAYRRAADRFSVDVRLTPGEITVEVRNPIGKSGDTNLTRLDRTIQWIRGFQDPFEAFLQRLKEISWESLNTNESRLGLVRIAYEGQALLDFYVNEDDTLAVSAIRRI